MMEFKDILKDLRKEANVTQRDIALKCELSPQCISQLEMGLRHPTGYTLIALADYFDCSTDYLLGRSDEFEPKFPCSQKKEKANFTPDEKELLKLFQSLDPLHQKQVLGYVEGFAERAHPNKKNF